jgi:hypothetical protein
LQELKITDKYKHDFVVNLTTNTSEIRARKGRLSDQTDLKGSFFRISGRWGSPQVLLFLLFVSFLL